MALFERVSTSTIPALLRLGFAAKLVNPASSKCLTADSLGNLSLAKEESSALWTVVSRDSFENEGATAPRCALAIVADEFAVPRYLSLDGDRPCVSEQPGAVRMIIPDAPRGGTRDLEVSVRQVLQDKLYLSCDGQGEGKTSLSRKKDRHERFQLRVLAESIGRGPGYKVCENAALVSLSEALTYAVLELGVRFRLRTIHERVLCGDGVDRKSKKKDKMALVLQSEARSSVSDSSEAELVFQSTRRASPTEGEGVQSALTYVFEEMSGQGFLSISPANVKRSKSVILRESVVLLSRLGPEELEADGAVLSVRSSPNHWGGLHLGEASQQGEQSAKIDWLMAGPRGRLELRGHTGDWEVFTLEFVQQSMKAALGELPGSRLFDEADAADRARVRAEIAAQVTAARSGSSSSKKPSKNTGGAFNHAAALGAIAAPAAPASSASASAKAGTANHGAATGAKKKGKKASKASSGVDNASSSASAAPSTGVAAAVATSALPRNQARKKNAKKAKRSKKRASGTSGDSTGPRGAGQSQGPVTAPRAKSNEVSGSSTASALSDSSSSGSSDEAARVSASEAAAAPMSNGPPCAACGRPISGSYTKALGKNFHPQCFCCRMCHRPLLPGTGQFRERGGAPYCNPCYAQNIAPKCARCSKPIMDTVTTAMEKTWHKECLTCVICQLPLTQTFWLYADKPNEPRCSRCVTGSEEPMQGVNYGSTGRRAVNLPGSMFNNGGTRGPPPAAPWGGQAPSVPASAPQGGRARLTTPVVLPGSR